jgi:thiamine pyrophosphate-dependent acetolactate synthase large subunit-like protein
LIRKACLKSDLVITVGHDMQRTLINRFNNTNVPNNVVINNWIDEKEIYPLNKSNKNIIKFKKKYHLDNKFVIMYSGNIGLFYDSRKYY